jgi:sensor histidine kinase YesM
VTAYKKINQGSVALLSWVIIVIINFFQLLYVKYTVPGRFDWQDVIYYPISSMTIGLLLIYLFLLPFFKKIRKLNVGWQIPLFILHGFLYTTIYIVLIFFQISLWSEKMDTQAFFVTVHRFFYTDFHNIAKNYFFLLAIFIAIEYINKREESLLAQKNLENQLREIKLQALESRLHPHFLFNTLNGIAALVEEHPLRAQDAVIQLSDLLRFSLEANMQKVISMDDELALLKKFIAIEKMRYEDQLAFTLKIDPAIDVKKEIMPPLIFQPIVENAIKHGFKGLQSKLSIEMDIQPYVIFIKNNGASLTGNEAEGNGLKIVRQRLEYHFGKSVTLELYQQNAWIVCAIKGIRL